MGISLGARRLISQEDSAMAPRPDVPRSRFLGSWSHKTTFDAGLLIPFLVDEVLPGDHLKYDVTAYLRMATPLFPLMDSQRVDTFFFFVPYRLVWANWVRMMGEQDSPTDSIDYTVPQVVSPPGGFSPFSLFDYMGLPTALDPAGTVSVSALPLRAYDLVYHEWFRDQNLINSTRPSTGNGPDSNAIWFVRRRAKSADYFTAALPFAQKFTPPTIPLAGTAPVIGIASPNTLAYTAGTPAGYTMSNGAAPSLWSGYAAMSTFVARGDGSGNPRTPMIYADLAAATGVAINTFRQAFLVQQLLEKDARGGTRYTESNWFHFGVRSPDMRLQRPEYIGGGSSPLNVTPIAQTAPSAGVTVGALGAAGTSVGEHRASYAATEHGVVIGLINVKSELSYQQGLHRMWTRRTRLEHYYPTLAGLGEQAILRKELYAQGTANDDLVFGYQERWHELRTRTSMVTGQFRSTTAGTLDAWHLAQRFTSPPVLGQTFIEDTPPMSRVLAAGTQANNQQYLADILIRREAVRPVPMYGTPVELGRF